MTRGSVGGKLFAGVGASAHHGVDVKCDSVGTAEVLSACGRALAAPWYHKSWVRLPEGLIDDAELRERIVTPYAIIRATLPKKVQAALARQTEAD